MTSQNSILKTVFLLFTCLVISSCSKEETIGNRGTTNVATGSDAWQIPIEEIRDGGPGKDGIPSVDDPRFVPAEAIDFMSSTDLILTMKVDDDLRSYPHPVLDWHEIVNDRAGTKAVSITYCPLTGTGTAWNRTLNGVETTFGVSGLLYRNNLIPYDRETDSNWSQILLTCVEGDLAGQEVQTYPLVEMGWPIYQKMFPGSPVLSTDTGIDRDYDRYPYGDYRTNHDAFIFARVKQDDRLPSKERVLGLVVNQQAKVYRFTSFANGLALMHDTFGGLDVVVFGSQPDNIMMAYQAALIDGTPLQFTAEKSLEEGGNVMRDQLGNTWNIFGEAVSGPNVGESLRKATAFMGYWFSFSEFFIDPEIHE